MGLIFSTRPYSKHSLPALSLLLDTKRSLIRSDFQRHLSRLSAYSVEKLLNKEAPHEIIGLIDFRDGVLCHDGQQR